MELKNPTIHVIKQYADSFDQNEVTGTNYSAVKKLFKKFQKNSDLKIILIKVATLNALYGTNIKSLMPVAKRILELKIDNKIRGNCIAIVNEIARVKTNKGDERNNYSFATKYCHFHNDKFYPIFDSYVKKLLNAYNKQDKFCERTNLRNFKEFRSFLSEFRRKYDISEDTVSLPELDKFLWFHGKEIFKN